MTSMLADMEKYKVFTHSLTKNCFFIQK